MPIIECIKKEFKEAVVDQCKGAKKNQKFNIFNNNKIKSHVILSDEKLKEKLDITSKIPDCIIFIEGSQCLAIGIVELKSKDISKAEKQLLDGQEIVNEKILKICSDNKEREYCFIIIADSWNSRIKHKIEQQKTINGNKVRCLTYKTNLTFCDICHCC